ncbi:hypothetical protein PHLGIDRAFT_287800 [Phlebiopsis gigantea 11061_1 CR5-6]|uniref:Uncharacterized protein n=1 Tax=Phlebiopsis gigantea (strain 11061_1 CR5-6) TaxID=745531 RepID=A0A0C3SBB0_PHLG1|nr:hypothetical protein PHLGIDRAFT_287800 [Phlebiopsis gigantea 11061_1 CR5-6]
MAIVYQSCDIARYSKSNPRPAQRLVGPESREDRVQFEDAALPSYSGHAVQTYSLLRPRDNRINSFTRGLRECSARGVALKNRCSRSRASGTIGRGAPGHDSDVMAFWLGRTTRSTSTLPFRNSTPARRANPATHQVCLLGASLRPRIPGRSPRQSRTRAAAPPLDDCGLANRPSPRARADPRLITHANLSLPRQTRTAAYD